MADVAVLLEVPGLRSPSVDLGAQPDPTFGPHRTPLDGGLALVVLPADWGAPESGLGVTLAGRFQRTRWEGEATPPTDVDVARVEADLLWARWLGTRELIDDQGMPRWTPPFTPLVTLGVGAGAVHYERWYPGAHAEASLGASVALAPLVRPGLRFLARARLTGFLHPSAYGSCPMGQPCASFDPSEVALALQLGILG